MGHHHNQESDLAHAEELLRQYQMQGHDGDDDQESVSLLKYFRELYDEKREIFKKIFPEELGHHHDMLKKIGAVLPHDHHHQNNDKVKFQTRSLSIGEGDIKLEMFKVKTFDVKGGQAVNVGAK